ncbi:conjugal transfer protein [Carnobacterium gallinarum]|uniref:conjugal transfer protein n=1 Tax=Carnobacterium gallinarum TaxID=2749 RepID=UPI00054F83EA|nr:conjugal transfer protein [Carnobacterium gallinarum]
MKIKIERKEKVIKQKKVPTIKVGTHKKTTTLLWVLLASSLLFAIYKNFTAIDMHTVHEKEVIEQRIVDTSKIQSFSKNFIQLFYSWEHQPDALKNRTESLEGYLTDELQLLNADTIRTDIPTSSIVGSIQFWEIKQLDNHNFDVLFSVSQVITEQNNKQTIESVYTLTVYVDNEQNMVITKNPTVSSHPTKSSYQLANQTTDNTIEATTIKEIDSFLETFFKIYTVASKEELSYYVSNSVLKPIEKEYLFIEILNPVYTKEKNENISVQLSVKYLNQQTKAYQISQFDLELQKFENWMIVE